MREPGAEDPARPAGDALWPWALVVFLATCALFSGALGHEFVDYDDPDYVLENELIGDGLSVEAVKNAFTRAHAANWHPLTWLSHALDRSLFGLQPAGHHATSVVLHALTAALLFAALARAVASHWIALVLAALFAWHPLRAESVAWVSERKDVLSGFFAICTVIAWARWVRERSLKRYLLVLGLYAAGLLSKPMLVTLPVLLLCVDRWPLGREGWNLREKLPLFAMAAGTVVVTLVTQSEEGATSGLETVGLGLRLENAAASTGTYLLQTLWPRGLAVFYPHPSIFGESRMTAALLSVLVLVALGAAAWRLRERAPWFGAGLCWYLVALLPVLGLVQVGMQAQADRYTYLPSFGLVVVLGLGAHALLERLRLTPSQAGLVLGLPLLALGFLTWRQVGTWRDTDSLFERATRVTERNFVAWDKLGRARAQRGDTRAAIEAFEQGLELGINARDFAEQLGPLYADVAFEDGGHRELLTRNLPGSTMVDALTRLGQRELAVERLEDGLASFEAALALSPADAISHFNVGAARERIGDLDGARASFLRALELDPEFVLARERAAALAPEAPPESEEPR